MHAGRQTMQAGRMRDVRWGGRGTKKQGITLARCTIMSSGIYRENSEEI